MSFSGNMSSWHGAQSGYHLPPYDPHPSGCFDTLLQDLTAEYYLQ